MRLTVAQIRRMAEDTKKSRPDDVIDLEGITRGGVTIGEVAAHELRSGERRVITPVGRHR